jgi:hypothetical protein
MDFPFKAYWATRARDFGAFAIFEVEVVGELAPNKRKYNDPNGAYRIAVKKLVWQNAAYEKWGRARVIDKVYAIDRNKIFYTTAGAIHKIKNDYVPGELKHVKDMIYYCESNHRFLLQKAAEYTGSLMSWDEEVRNLHNLSIDLGD